jgi:hypothetical protein
MRRDEERLEELFERLRLALRTPAEGELRSVARAASAVDRVPVRQAARRAPRWARAAALAVVLGVGVGFGLGAWLTPSGSATSSFVGFGFLPAKGWTVIQSGTVGATGAATAIAANVPLDAADGLGGPPRATIDSLPRSGVVIFARFTTRGDAGEDVRFAVRGLPLRLADSGSLGPAAYRLRAGVDGYNIDARTYFGSAPPSAGMRAAAQAQLNRLVVAAERVTIFARPTILGQQPVSLFGSVDNGKAGEEIAIQAKDCGRQFFRVVAGATTNQGGGWSTDYFPSITTTMRAVWNGVASAQVTVRQRAPVRLSRVPSSARQLEVGVIAKKPFWRRIVVIERFDRRLGKWMKVKSVVLTKQVTTGTYVWTTARFTTSVPRGTLIRALVPLAEARPCYLAGVSRQLRT